MNDELLRFVRESLGRGLPRASIREQLLAAGWRADEIEAALAAYAEADFPIPVPRRRPYLSAREAFLYLVLFATLYASAFNVGQVLFAMIERAIPDPLHPATDWSRFGVWTRGATAGLVIAFPIFLMLSRLIGGEVRREPEKRGSPVRKWLTYLTLLIAALVIIGDLTVLVTRLLAGELAPRFVLKVLVVFLIAATAFWHYLSDLRREERGAGAPAPGATPLARLAAVAVLAVTASGLFFSGSPREARLRQLDERRVEQLRALSGAIEAFARARGRVPDSLAVLLRLPDTFGAETLRDPASGRPFEYRALDSLRYELCAEFQLDDTKPEAPGAVRPRSEFWKHPAGRHCFTFEVTPRVADPVAPPTIGP
jgi:hypothetical protein